MTHVRCLVLCGVMMSSAHSFADVFSCKALAVLSSGGSVGSSCGERFEAKNADVALKACATPKGQIVDGASGQGCCEELAYHYKEDRKTRIELETIRQEPSHKSYDKKLICKAPGGK